jgi:hypothetical protein
LADPPVAGLIRRAAADNDHGCKYEEINYFDPNPVSCRFVLER